jgi:hypothetical protein
MPVSTQRTEVLRFFATYTFTYATQISRSIAPNSVLPSLPRVPLLSAFATGSSDGVGSIQDRSAERVRHRKGLSRALLVGCAGGTLSTGGARRQACCSCRPLPQATPICRFGRAIQPLNGHCSPRPHQEAQKGRSGLLSYGRGTRKTSWSGRLARAPSKYPFGYRRGTG